MTECFVKTEFPFYPIATIINRELYPKWTIGKGDVQDYPTISRGMVYVCICGQNRDWIYVGFVTAVGSPSQRLSQQISGIGSKFTRTHVVQWVHQIIYPATKQTELDVTKYFAMTMSKATQVRGSNWCSIDPTIPSPWQHGR